jgi:hypothetical protein
MGRTADHALVMAQLITNGKRHGLHPFVVPLRDRKTRQPLPGVVVGDIGPKIGFNGLDNGLLSLHKIRVPHVNMLARFSSVDAATGIYRPPLRPQLAYGSMTAVRARLVKDSAMQLARATTIAVRVSIPSRVSHALIVALAVLCGQEAVATGSYPCWLRVTSVGLPIGSSTLAACPCRCIRPVLQ